MDETQTIEIEIELDVAADHAWAAVATPEGLAAWLAPDVALGEVAPGAAGLVVDDDGVTRRLCVREVNHGRSVTFTWWREDEPTEATTVTLLLTPCGAGLTRLRIVETVVAATTAHARASVWLGSLGLLALALAGARARA